jgi:hypothetical protein
MGGGGGMGGGQTGLAIECPSDAVGKVRDVHPVSSESSKSKLFARLARAQYYRA